MFRRVSIGNVECRLQRINDDQTHRCDRLRQYLGARQQRALALNFGKYGRGQCRPRRHQNGLRIGAVLGLRQEVGGDEFGVLLTDVESPSALSDIAERLLAHCDAALRIGGASQGADLMVQVAREHGLQAFMRLQEIPGCEGLEEPGD